MKKIFVIALFAGVSANACPNLTGEFTCHNEDGFENEVTVSQSQAGGITTYTVVEDGDTQSIVADGVTHVTSEKNQDYEYYAEETYSCSADDKLVQTFLEKYSDTDSAYTERGSSEVSLDANNAIVMKTDVTTEDQSGTEQTTDTTICERK